MKVIGKKRYRYLSHSVRNPHHKCDSISQAKMLSLARPYFLFLYVDRMVFPFSAQRNKAVLLLLSKFVPFSWSANDPKEEGPRSVSHWDGEKGWDGNQCFAHRCTVQFYDPLELLWKCSPMLRLSMLIKSFACDVSARAHARTHGASELIIHPPRITRNWRSRGLRSPVAQLNAARVVELCGDMRGMLLLVCTICMRHDESGFRRVYLFAS